MPTLFNEIYDSFLAQITSYEYTNFTEEELYIELKQILKSSLAECSFTDISANFILNEFNRELTDIEINIITYNMIVKWYNPKINNIELVKQSLSSKDYQFFSQANHLNELRKARADAIAQFHYWNNKYKMDKYAQELKTSIKNKNKPKKVELPSWLT